MTILLLTSPATGELKTLDCLNALHSQQFLYHDNNDNRFVIHKTPNLTQPYIKVMRLAQKAAMFK